MTHLTTHNTFSIRHATSGVSSVAKLRKLILRREICVSQVQQKSLVISKRISNAYPHSIAPMAVGKTYPMPQIF